MMSMKPPVLGTLSEKGWVKHPPEMLDSLLSYYISSEYSESDIAYGHVKSLSYDIVRFNQNPSLLERNVSTSLEEMFTPYFPEGVNVDVTVKPSVDKPDTELDIVVSVVVVREGIRYDLGKAISIIDGKVQRRMRLQGEA